MDHAAWKDVGALVVSLIGRQPVPMQIFSWLLVAFLALMLVEGLHATFLPRRVASRIRRRSALDHQTAMPRQHTKTESMPATPPQSRSALTKPVPVRNAKRVERIVNRREPSRPKIRRMSSYFEYAGAPPETLAPQIEAAAQDPVLGEV